MLSTTTIAGRLTRAPQLRQTPGGKDVTTLRVAVSDHRLEGDTATSTSTSGSSPPTTP